MRAQMHKDCLRDAEKSVAYGSRDFGGFSLSLSLSLCLSHSVLRIQHEAAQSEEGLFQVPRQFAGLHLEPDLAK